MFDVEQIYRDLRRCMLRDKALLRRRLNGLKRRFDKGLPYEQGLSDLKQRLAQSCEQRQQRSPQTLKLEVPTELPIEAKAGEICEAIRNHQILIIAGETGSGKTTQLPKLCLQAGRGIDGWIGCTQPRRIAARSMAARVAEELQVPIGQAVGYQVRFDERVNEHSLIKFMTDGILLSETQADRELWAYDTLIIDEAHERSLNIDFLLGYLKKLLPRRPDLKLIITSATIDTERFAQHFHAPVIQVSGRSYPVEIRYSPLVLEQENKVKDLPSGIVDAVHELNRIDPLGDILVFLPGERDINEASDALEGARFRDTEVMPLYARLSAKQQSRVFHPGSKRRIILSTNVAETSLTVPRIRFVIDSGLARISRYSHRSKVQRLPIEAISQASANQRSGRCGRLGPGVCIRLYDEEQWLQRAEFTPPEIIRTNLASVILRMAALKLGSLEDFPFIDPPETSLVRDGYQLLQELGALDKQQKLTRIGRDLSLWPLDVRLARMMLQARDLGCVEAVATITAVMAIQDPRERPPDAMQKADTAHRQWQDKKSDFVSFLNLWRDAEQQRRELSNRQFRQWCEMNFIHYLRFREWADIRRQLLETASELGWKSQRVDPDFDSLHQALLPALLGQVGVRDDQNYLSARGRRFDIFPGSGLFSTKAAWVMSAFLVETTRIYARTNAAIEVSWLEKAAAHLIKRRYFDPYWSKRYGRVMGYEAVTLYGLPLVEKRRIHYGPQAPTEAREILIREALVGGALNLKAPFIKHNTQQVAEIEDLERRQRRRDLLVDEQQRFAFFDALIPQDIITLKSFNRWREKAEQHQAQILFYQREDLLVSDAQQVPVLFPDHLDIAGVRFKLHYRLEPNHPNDGVTIRVPLHLLNTLSTQELEWLVPGLLRDKVVALIKSMPKSLRRLFVPIPDMADQFLASKPDQSKSLSQSLARFLSHHGDTALQEQSFDLSRLADYLLFNIQVFDEHALVASGRDLVQLQADHGDAAREDFIDKASDQLTADGHKKWDFEPIPSTVELEGGVEAYPALVDQQDSVGIRLFDQRSEADEFHLYGLYRLCELTLRDKFRYLKHHSPVNQTMGLQYQSVDRMDQLKQDLAVAAGLQIIRDLGHEVRDQANFQYLSNVVRSDLLAVANQMNKALKTALESYYRIRQKLAERDFIALFPWAAEDIPQQLDFLIYPGFLTETSAQRLAEYPRYLRAVEIRLDSLEIDPQRDQQRQESLSGFWENYLQRAEQNSTDLVRFRWLIEEYRVSLFAQKLKTSEPVSAKRLVNLFREIQDAEQN